MKTKTTAKKNPAPTKRVPAATAPDKPLMSVVIRAHIAEFFGPDGAHLSTVANGPLGSDAGDKLAAAILLLRESHALTVTHA